MRKNDSHLIKMRGMFLVQFLEDGKIVRDLGWRENQITDGGILQFLVNALLPLATGKKIGWMSVGLGGAPIPGDNVLEDEISTRSAVTGTAIGSNKARFLAIFPSSSCLSAHPVTISNVGLFDSDIVATSVLFSGGLIDPLQNRIWLVNQAVNVTYDIEFV